MSCRSSCFSSSSYVEQFWGGTRTQNNNLRSKWKQITFPFEIGQKTKKCPSPFVSLSPKSITDIEIAGSIVNISPQPTNVFIEFYLGGKKVHRSRKIQVVGNYWELSYNIYTSENGCLDVTFSADAGDAAFNQVKSFSWHYNNDNNCCREDVRFNLAAIEESVHKGSRTTGSGQVKNIDNIQIYNQPGDLPIAVDPTPQPVMTNSLILSRLPFHAQGTFTIGGFCTQSQSKTLYFRIRVGTELSPIIPFSSISKIPTNDTWCASLQWDVAEDNRRVVVTASLTSSTIQVCKLVSFPLVLPSPSLWPIIGGGPQGTSELFVSADSGTFTMFGVQEVVVAPIVGEKEDSKTKNGSMFLLAPIPPVSQHVRTTLISGRSPLNFPLERLYGNVVFTSPEWRRSQILVPRFNSPIPMTPLNLPQGGFRVGFNARGRYRNIRLIGNTGLFWFRVNLWATESGSDRVGDASLTCIAAFRLTDALVGNSSLRWFIRIELEGNVNNVGTLTINAHYRTADVEGVVDNIRYTYPRTSMALHPPDSTQVTLPTFRSANLEMFVEAADNAWAQVESAYSNFQG